MDKDTTGLLILTNDGDLTYKLTHPRFETKKIYNVKLNKSLEEKHRKELEAGIRLEEGVTAKCSILFSNLEASKSNLFPVTKGNEQYSFVDTPDPLTYLSNKTFNSNHFLFFCIYEFTVINKFQVIEMGYGYK